MATASNQALIDALCWQLRALRLAGLKRIPQLLSEPAPRVAASAEAPAAEAATAPAGGSVSWRDAARRLRDHVASLGGAPAPQRPAASAAEKPVAAQPSATGGRKPSGGDPVLRPSRPVDPEAEAELARLAEEVAGCTRCPELARSRTQTVFCDGPSNADLMFIGEAPGEEEDRQGVAFVGRAGQLLTKIIAGGMKMRREDVYICNILKCRPPGNRNPQPDEAAHCREYLDRQIELVRPKIICLLGGIATRFLLDDATPVGRMRGRWHTYRGMPVRVTYHPAYLLRNYTPDARQKVWDDVLEVVAKLKELHDRPGGPRDDAEELF